MSDVKPATATKMMTGNTNNIPVGATAVVEPKVVFGGFIDPPKMQVRGPLSNRLNKGYYRIYTNGLFTYAKDNNDPDERAIQWIVGVTSVEKVDEKSEPAAFPGTNLRLKSFKGHRDVAVPETTVQSWVTAIDNAAATQRAEKEAQKITDQNEIKLYDDARVALYQDRIVVKWYHFPFGSNKVLSISQIRSVQVPKGLDIFEVKSWGMAMDFHVWWARAFKILAHTGLYSEPEPRLVLEHCKWPAVGFSCKDRNALLSQLDMLLNQSPDT